MQVAVRMPSKGTCVTLWMHEHFVVYKNKSKPKGKRELDIYQAMEFRTGGDMPVDCRVGLSEKELAQIWVKVLYFALCAGSQNQKGKPRYAEGQVYISERE